MPVDSILVISEKKIEIFEKNSLFRKLWKKNENKKVLKKKIFEKKIFEKKNWKKINLEKKIEIFF